MHAWASFFLSERRLGLVARVLLFGAVIARRRRQVSRRNSYSDRDMFEGGEDEEDVPMKVSGLLKFRTALAAVWNHLLRHGSIPGASNRDRTAARACTLVAKCFATTVPLIRLCSRGGGI